MQILYEDNHLIAVHKPAGIPVQEDESGDTPLSEMVKEYIKKKYRKPGEVYLGVLHRLDRPVAGVVLFARTSKAAARVSEMFREKKMVKTYLAIVDKKPPNPEGTLTNYIYKDKDANRSHCYVKEKPGSQWAELDYKQVEEADGQYLLEVSPKTGRPHQIRAQLSAMGCVIHGDLKYGAKEPMKDKSICLLARKLEFMHPVRDEKITIISKIPPDKAWGRFLSNVNLERSVGQDNKPKSTEDSYRGRPKRNIS
jgi:23S rRNA pseudouridine1911/1915/1917 synthase